MTYLTREYLDEWNYKLPLIYQFYKPKEGR
jgi:hypothetical protein